MDPFADIRPFHDDEVRPVLARLLQDPECLSAVARLRMPRLGRWFPGLTQALVRRVLQRQLQSVQDVRAFQDVVKSYMDHMIESTTSGFSVSGLEALPEGCAYLFMSNHRDIALDPAFVNYALYHNEHDTVRIAIGDNLLSKPFVSDLMRLNKSFIVKRSAKGPRQLFAAFKQLSGYIRHSLLEENVPIWIAQREGRAKDSNDRTEPAILKMIAMAADRGADLSAYLGSLRIVPVAISYEWDPCDQRKARELDTIAREGRYAKAEHEDVASIAAGIAGQKGCVHVAFGEPLSGDLSDPDQVAAQMDTQIWRNYHLHASNWAAYRLREGSLPASCTFTTAQLDQAADLLEQRRTGLSEGERRILLDIYANPVANQLAAHAD